MKAMSMMALCCLAMAGLLVPQAAWAGCNQECLPNFQGCWRCVNSSGGAERINCIQLSSCRCTEQVTCGGAVAASAEPGVERPVTPEAFGIFAAADSLSCLAPVAL
jgi:hypothetical protein